MAFKDKDAQGGTRNSRLLTYADLIEAAQPVDENFIPLVKEIIGEHLLERKELATLIEKLHIKGGPTYDVKPLANVVKGLEQDAITKTTDLAKMVRGLVAARRSEGQSMFLMLQGLLGGGSAPSDIGDLPTGPIN